MNNKTKKILIIDDEEVFRDAIRDALTPCGYHCISESDPIEGILRLKKEPFDLILLDIMMDPLDGWDTLEHIKSQIKGHQTPIIMSSAKKLQADEIIRYSGQVSGFLTKPFLDTDFCDAVSGFFSWYDQLISQINTLESQGVPHEVCEQWVTLSCHIRAINQMNEQLSSRCISDQYPSEEECLAHKKAQIDMMLSEKIQQRERIQSQYSVFTESVA